MENHNDLRQLISVYHDGEATAAESKIVEQHIQECAECKKYLQELQKLSSSLKEWNAENLSLDLEQKINKRFLDLKSKEESHMKSNISVVTIGATGVALILFAVVLHNNMLQPAGHQQIAKLNESIHSGIKAAQGSRTEVSQLAQNKKEDVIARELAKVKSSVSGLTAERGKDQLALKSATDSIGDKFSPGNQAIVAGKGATIQYEPYYLSTNYDLKDQMNFEVAGKNSDVERRIISGAPPLAAQKMVMGKQATQYAREYWGGGGVDELTVNYPQYYYEQPLNTEEYGRTLENNFFDAKADPLSTFSIDVDTASYSNVRRFLTQGQLPPSDAVRIEEMINYFTYDYPQPSWGQPFSITMEAAPCPWNPQNNLVLIGLQGKNLQHDRLPASNLVFLIDVSGSMAQANKLPLVQESFRMLVNSLRSEDRVSIVVYAGSAGLVLDSTSGDQKSLILSAIDRLQAGGSTAGGQGIQLAYQVAQRSFIRGGNNRVILATDGDFNVGISSDNDLVNLIEEKRNQGVFLTVLGFGMGNYKDSKMEKLADKGNGNYAYIDTNQEAHKVMVQELGTMLFPIAKDVKIQVEFNPAHVKSYRLVGYENRVLAKEDFNDDTKDAGELGAGHSVTAFYEIVPASLYQPFVDDTRKVDPLKYQEVKVKSNAELMTVKLRYKDPNGSVSRLLSRTLIPNQVGWSYVSNNFKFASAVAEFGLLLKNSPHRGSANYHNATQRAQGAIGNDPWGYRGEFLRLVDRAASLSGNNYYIPPEPVPFYQGSQNPILFKGGR